MSQILISVDYEVFGRVQGVCFRMYAEEKARKAGVVGWIRNSSQGTVTGQVQGPEDKVNEIWYCSHDAEGKPVSESALSTLRKAWLTSVGSPSSRIERANFSNEREIPKLDFTGFITRY
ncbi:acylphosphatase-2 isoform X2 [Hemicordylus capensis]|uniref:acylphosphatase-2 isoform X2 n=1 Tax=Hemicordylus capensis TaxID=884348 RepID=UPI0023043F2C|nr:acylphosphatase-2 isoform X2 [Hemicordylus capensis]